MMKLSLILIIISLFANAGSKDQFNEILWKPNDRSDWYEWWYYKVVEPKTQKAYYFVYGLVNPWDTKKEMAASKVFVTAGSFSENMIIEQQFPMNSYSARRDINQKSDPIFKIGKNNFLSPTETSGEIINDKKQHVRWYFKTERQWEFNAMSWALFAPEISNIFWYPIQASLKMTGWIDFNGDRVEFENALGYQDRNWGRSFPKWWAWIVSQNFKNSPGTVLASGGGLPRIKGLGNVLDGICIGIFHQGKEYKFRLTDGHRIKMNVRFGKWYVEAINHSNEKIILEAYAPKEKFMILPFTTPQGEIFKDYETLNGYARFKLYKRKFLGQPWSLIADLETDEAGIEYGSYQEYSPTNSGEDMPPTFEDLYVKQVKLQ